MNRFQKARMRKQSSFTKSFDSPGMDTGIIIGIFLSTLFIAFGVVFSGNTGFAASLFGIAIVLGGSYAAVMVQHSSSELRAARVKFVEILRPTSRSSRSLIEYFIDLSQRVRKQGPMIMEDEASRARDPFLRKGLELAVDGQNSSTIRKILSTELDISRHTENKASDIFRALGNYAPAFGLIGTLIGLIQMLGSLSDPSKVGPAMAIALTTTLYGAVLSNLVFTPIAGKLRAKADGEILWRSIIIEGISSIRRDENSLMLEQRLQSFLPKVNNG